MSIHKSLVTKGRLKRHRNVLSRTERILKLEEEEKWSAEQDSVFCLPKVRVARLKRAHAKKKEEVVEGEAAAAEAVEGAPKEGSAKEGAAARPAAGQKKK